MQKNILVVGGNAAGCAAAVKAKRVSPQSNVMLFEAGEHISTGTCELPYLIGGEIKDHNDIILFNPDTFQKSKGVEVFIHHRVAQIDRKGKRILVKNNSNDDVKSFDYDKLILATGSKSKSLPLFKNYYKNLFRLKSVTDYTKIKSYLDNNKVNKVLVIGAGYIGLEVAEGFSKRDMEVAIIEKTELPMPGYDKDIRTKILDELEHNNVRFEGSVGDVKFLTDGELITGINLDGRILEFDLVLSATGIEPDNDLALSAKLETGKSGGLKTDKRQKTSDPNIFAAGDNVEVINKISNRPDYIPIATLAQKQGHVAGANAAGGNEFFEPVIKNVAVKIFNKIFVHVGLTADEAFEHRYNFRSVTGEANNLVKVMPQSQKVTGRIFYDAGSNNILGASFLGQQEVIGFGDLISSFIHNNIKAGKLAEINYNYTPPYSPFINLLSVLGRKIKKEM